MQMPARGPSPAAAALAAMEPALSLNERLRRHPRERLLVTPLLWRQIHLDLMACTFGRAERAPPAADARFARPGSGSRRRQAARLARLQSLVSLVRDGGAAMFRLRNRAVADMLAARDGPLCLSCVARRRPGCWL